MATALTTAELIRELALSNRLMLLGGLAVVTHGHSRPTYDADVWLDSTLNAEEWSIALEKVICRYPALSIVSIGDWQPVLSKNLPTVAEEDGVVRILGASQPLDVFRKPNEMPAELFCAAWERGDSLDDGTRVLDVIDLLVTKQETGRTKDTQDIAFLEAKAEEKYLTELPLVSAEKASAMLERFLTPKIAESALKHPAEIIRQLGRQFLLELAAAGDPFAAEMVRENKLEG